MSVKTYIIIPYDEVNETSLDLIENGRQITLQWTSLSEGNTPITFTKKELEKLRKFLNKRYDWLDK